MFKVVVITLCLVIYTSCQQLSRFYKRAGVRGLPQHVIESLECNDALYCMVMCTYKTECITASWSQGNYLLAVVNIVLCLFPAILKVYVTHYESSKQFVLKLPKLDSISLLHFNSWFVQMLLYPHKLILLLLSFQCNVYFTTTVL